jgi:sugar lactone lactonase YvrE
MSATSTKPEISGGVRFKRFLIIGGFGLLALLITLVTLYLVFQGGARREGVGLLAGSTVKPFTTFEGDTVFPFGIAQDAAGALYVSSFGEGRIYKIGTDGKATRWIDANGGLTAPAALAVAPDRSLYVVDFSNSDPNKGIGVIKHIDTDGKISQPATLQGLSGLSFLSGISVDPAGDLFVALTARGEVWRFPPGKAGAVWAVVPHRSAATQTANNATSTLAQPTALLFDTVKNAVYVADSDSGLIYRYAVNADGSAGPPTEVITLVDKIVAGFALDAKGQVLFTQWGKEDGWLNRLDAQGGLTQLAHNFRAPAGVASAADGTIYVVNSDLPGLLRQGVISIFGGAKPPFTIDRVTLKP